MHRNVLILHFSLDQPAKVMGSNRLCLSALEVKVDYINKIPRYELWDEASKKCTDFKASY
jgi:hypothetical protein